MEHTANDPAPMMAPAMPTSAMPAVETTMPPTHVPDPMPRLKIPEYADMATAELSSDEFAENLGLKHHVVGGVERAPQRATRAGGNEVERREKEDAHGRRHADHRHAHERKPQARVRAREQRASDARRAVEHERERDEVVRRSPRLAAKNGSM